MNINKKIDDITFENPYSLSEEEKNKFLMENLSLLHEHHEKFCEGYNRYNQFFHNLKPFCRLTDYPYLPVRLFKNKDLKSVDDNDVFKTLNSSGTSGSVSKIYLDKQTSSRQSKVLNTISKYFIGNQRVPMCIIDSKELLQDRTKFNARAAGILGYSVFGRNHFYCLDSNLDLKVDEFLEFINSFSGKPILFFGFTYLVWSKFVEKLKSLNLSINIHPDSLLIHGGGWKKLVDKNISNDYFKSKLDDVIGLKRVYNYYGMIEQVGSVFMECENGMLHCSNYSDVIIRNKSNYSDVGFGQEGLIQVISLLPTSYPGNSILTEDVGTIFGVDNCLCGLKGKYFKVNGRLPQAELRGCSDTRKI